MNDRARPNRGWLEAAQAVQAETVKLRRAIHAEPELGLQTPKTMAKVRAALADLSLEWKTGKSTTGAVAILRGGRPGRTVLLRGDMDALPMPEDTGLAFSSTVANTMHACGHDTHTAMLASAARLMSARRDSLAGTVLFMFQPGEEGHHGARFMMEDGLLSDPAPEAAFALHIYPNAPAGVFGSRPGPLLASADRIMVDVRGKGGHASMPHDAIDPVPVACEIVTAMQVFITRRIDIFDPAVVTIAKIESGSTNNVIPESASLLGTIRTQSEAARERVHAGLKRVAENVARAHECEAEVKIERGFPVTVCDPRAFALAQQTIGELFGAQSWLTMASPLMGAEDFSYVLQKTPGAMLFLGVCPEGQMWKSACPCHSNRMVLNEAMLSRGVAAHCAIAENYLERGFA
ncbi:MAG TPA: M20 family metallopeptidase [Burkholderiales bacterium]|jgi:hippurate hydrolase|nr:M20 family metallopeptidase [Burkholderiales bacterium]